MRLEVATLNAAMLEVAALGLSCVIYWDLKPATDWLHNHTLGPLIPIAILVVISFPPLLGQELVTTLVGVTWDLPEAFLIVTIGPLLDEITNYFVFRYACVAHGAKLEEKNLSFGLMAYVARNGSFWVILIIRYSAIPPHFATSVLSTVGISFWIFLGAAILTLPKQLVPVYVGYALQKLCHWTCYHTENSYLIEDGEAFIQRYNARRRGAPVHRLLPMFLSDSPTPSTLLLPKMVLFFATTRHAEHPVAVKY
ncbi:hypothetical protein C8R45DRAFT_1101627 [Mycena sanguinolenta]|nr:hypothetical protein C8R45DRAFT_1101627 [Mycena sanguinolenta]